MRARANEQKTKTQPRSAKDSILFSPLSKGRKEKEAARISREEKKERVAEGKVEAEAEGKRICCTGLLSRSSPSQEERRIRKEGGKP